MLILNSSRIALPASKRYILSWRNSPSSITIKVLWRYKNIKVEIIGFLGRVLGFLLRSTLFLPSIFDGYLSHSWAARPNRSKLPNFQCKKGWAALERLWSGSRAARAELELCSGRARARLSSSEFCGKIMMMHRNIKEHKTTIHGRWNCDSHE